MWACLAGMMIKWGIQYACLSPLPWGCVLQPPPSKPYQNITAAFPSPLFRVQRTAAHVILGENYTNYTEAMNSLSLETLEERRVGICTNFAKKAIKHPKFSTWFVKSIPNNNIRERKCKPVVEEPYLKPVVHRTKRFRKFPIPFLTNLINNTQVITESCNKWIMAFTSSCWTFTVTYITVISGYWHC